MPRLIGVPDTVIPGPPANTVIPVTDEPDDPTVKFCPPAVEAGVPGRAIAGSAGIMSTVCEGDRLLFRLGSIGLVEKLGSMAETSILGALAVDTILGSDLVGVAELSEDLGPPSKLCMSAPIPWPFSVPLETWFTEIEGTWAGLTEGIDFDLPRPRSCCKAAEDGTDAESTG